LTIKWKDTHDVFFLTSVHDNEFVETLLSRGARNKIKPSTVLDYHKYKTGVDRSDQMSYHSFARKTVRWWKKVVSAHILHSKTNKKKIPLEMFYEKIAKGLIASAGAEIQVHGKTNSPAGKLVGRDYFLYRISATHAKLEGKSQRSCCMCAERSRRQTGKTEEIHYDLLPKM
jgi:hypothetical protein